MIPDLSPTEQRVVEQYCRGFNDSEVADSLDMMLWTCKTHKKHIFKKWQINSTHEMVLLFIARLRNKDCEITEIRNKGISIFLLLLVIFQMAFVESDYARNINNVRTARTTRTGIARRSKDDTISNIQLFG